MVAAVAAYVFTREDFPVYLSAASSAQPPAAAPEAAPAVVAEPAAVAPSVDPQAANVAAASAVPGAQATAAAGERQIDLDFDSRTWVEIKDANNRVVLTGEFAAGTHQLAIGKPPFNVWIGKVSGVKVNYGDKRVDLTPYARDDVARLTLE